MISALIILDEEEKERDSDSVISWKKKKWKKNKNLIILFEGDKVIVQRIKSMSRVDRARK